MYNVGRLCIKIAGRDAKRKCAVIKVINNNYVMIDGETRRRKCNVAHLEPLDQTIDIKKDASHDEVKAAFKKAGIEIKDTKAKEKTEKPKKARNKKEEAVEDKPKEKKAAKSKVSAEKKPKKSETDKK
jgi:large subunit ribosomal protein L14e